MNIRTFGRQEIDRFTHEFEELFYSGDYMGMASYYAADAKLLAEDMELVQGHAAVERFWQVSCEGANKMGIKRSIEVHDSWASGDLGYVIGVVTLQIPNPGERYITNHVRYVTLWRQQESGSWQIIVDISNREPSSGAH